MKLATIKNVANKVHSPSVTSCPDITVLNKIN